MKIGVVYLWSRAIFNQVIVGFLLFNLLANAQSETSLQTEVVDASFNSTNANSTEPEAKSSGNITLTLAVVIPALVLVPLSIFILGKLIENPSKLQNIKKNVNKVDVIKNSDQASKGLDTMRPPHNSRDVTVQNLRDLTDCDVRDSGLLVYDADLDPEHHRISLPTYAPKSLDDTQEIR